MLAFVILIGVISITLGVSVWVALALVVVGALILKTAAEYITQRIESRNVERGDRPVLQLALP